MLHSPVGEEVIYSRKGTTQGNSLAMAICGSSTPLIDRTVPTGATQVWFADDAAGGGTLLRILSPDPNERKGQNWEHNIYKELPGSPSFGCLSGSERKEKTTRA